MASKKIIPALLIATVLAASASGSAFAGDRHDRGGNGLAIAAGILGAVAIGSIIANANSGPSYAPPQQVYQPAPQPYYPPQQVYYRPAPVYVQPAPVYVESRYYRERPAYHGYQREYRDGYYGR